ncbi:MAG: gliding motility-associated C-terminal domain-containing protein [Cyclobacteriaceae bacterium]|jgi:gliding motility-associated-like protein|nr:gliding motility-associated C-terminal domain-containing protein [Cyclobacteriaceae bacterium]
MKELVIILLGAFCLLVIPAHAQSVFNKGATVTVSANTIVAVQENLTNEGTLTNNGQLIISGAWQNLGTYNPGNGQINFNSDQPQVINHNDQSFQRLIISGAGEKIFSANITIESELALQSSILRSENDAKLIFNPGVIITGGSDASHIIGTVSHKGAGQWLYPIGDGTLYLPVVINNVTDAAAIGAITLRDLANGQTLSGTFEIPRLSNQRYFELAQTGSLASATITLPLRDDNLELADLARAVVAGSNAVAEPFASLGQSASTGSFVAGSVTSQTAPALAFYAVAAITDDRTVEVFNGISPNNLDDLNAYFRIQNIEYYPANKVTIFNRWGDRIYEARGYNNADVVFRGIGKAGKVPAGTYYYLISLGDGSKPRNGYLEIR